MGVEAVIERRRVRRRELLARAERFGAGLDPGLGVRALVVFGSVARGDFNVWSDVDVLVVAERLPSRLRDRLELFGGAEPGLEVVAWTPHEWRQALERGNRIAREACEHGVWLVGSADEASR